MERHLHAIVFLCSIFTAGLIVDPVPGYSTYLGEDNFEDGINIAVDDNDNVYITGETCSSPEQLSASSPMDNAVTLMWSLSTVSTDDDFADWKAMGNGFEVILGAPDKSFTDEEETGNATHRIRIAGDDPNLSFDAGQFVYVVNANSDFIFGSAQIELGAGLISATCYRAFVRQLCSMSEQGAASDWNFVNDEADAGDFCTTKGSFECSAEVNGKIDCESEGATITVRLTLEPSGCLDANFDIYLNGERVRDDLKDGDAGDLDPDAGEIEYLINASKTGRYGNAGLNTVTVRQDGGTCTFKEGECESVVEILSAPDAVACEDEMNVTLDANCMAIVTVDMVAEGELCGAELSDLEVIVYDGVYPNGTPDNRVESCGTFNYVLKTKDNVTIPGSFHECWGKIVAEDKTPPVVTPKPAKVDGIWKYVDHYENIQYTPYGCPYAAPNPSEQIYPDCFEDGYGVWNDNCSSFTFNRLVCTDVDAIYKDSRSWSDGDYPYFTGRPKAEDACGPVNLVSVDDWLEEFICEEMNGQVTARITRTFTYRDEKGNETSENQEICFYRPVVQLPDCKLHVDVCDFDEADADGDGVIDDLAPGNIRIADTDGDGKPENEIAAPFYLNGLCEKIYLTDHLCDLTVSFKDTAFPAPCGTKIIREWTILDWCWNSAETDRNTRYNLPESAECYLEEEDYNEQEGTWEEKTLVFEQHLIVGAFDPLIVECAAEEVSTGPFNCTAVVTEAHLNVQVSTTSTACVATGDPQIDFELWAYVEDPKRLGVFDFKLIGKSINGSVAGVAKGDYYVFLRVEDECGRIYSSITEGVKPTPEAADCTLSVVDKIEPTAVCNEELNVSLGGNHFTRMLNGGVGVVNAADIDEGSWDNCGPVKVLARRSIGDCVAEYNELVAGNPNIDAAPLADDAEWTPWAEQVYFICCDLDTQVRVELLVVDDANMDGVFQYGQLVNSRGELLYSLDNTNKCWLEIEPENKLPPVCTVEDVFISCLDLDFDPGDPAQVAAKFGDAREVLNIDSNCDNFEVTEVQSYNTDVCGVANVTRFITVRNPDGGAGLTCKQTIKVEEVNDYFLSFPGDEQGECADITGSDVMFASEGCDVLAVNRDTVLYEGSADECFKRLITYSLINWCEYDGETLEPTVIPRDLDQDGNREEDVLLIAEYDDLDDYSICDRAGGVEIPEGNQFLVKLYDDADGDKEVEKDQLPLKIMVRGSCGKRHVRSNQQGHVGPLVLRLSEQAGAGYNEAEACYDIYCSDEENYGITDQDLPGKEGYGEVFDDVVAYLCDNQTYVDQCWTPGFYEYTQLQKIFDNTAPRVEVTNDSLRFAAYSADCTGKATITFVVTDDCTAQTSVRRARILPDPELELVPIEVTAASLSGTDSFVVEAILPLGAHQLEVTAVDDCGNPVKKVIDFEVVDLKAPAPICISGIEIVLMPVDTNNDGRLDGGMNTVWATDFLASPNEDCSGEVIYSINRMGETPDSTKTSLTVSCDDPLLETLPIEIHAWDGAGNQDFCETFIVIVDQQRLCDPDTTSDGTVSGLIQTTARQGVQGVDVQLSGPQFGQQPSGADGRYAFGQLQTGYDYSVTPQLDKNHLNGVSTFDLVLISKHILGVKPFDSPYKHIAADVNRSGSITTLDLIQLRKLILGIEPAFTNNTSWRFIPAEYVFQNSADPFAEVFPEVINLNDLQGSASDADFVGVKVGDVNGSARANTLQAAAPRNMTGTLTLQTALVELTAGEEYTIPFTTEDLASVQGYQFTLAYDRNLVELVDVIEGVANEKNFGIFAEQGLITTSWHLSDFRLPDSEFPVFSLVLKAKAAVPLSEALHLSSRLTRAEAYSTSDELLDVTLDFGQGAVAGAGFALHQNQPNPFRTATLISFMLPEATPATLSIHDVSGRTLRVIRGDFAKGYNEVPLSKSSLPAGVLYYTLKTKDHAATKKMMVIE